MDINNSTALLKVSTGSYPVYFHQMRQALPDVSFPENPTEECLAEYGYAVVNPVARPAGDVVTEGAPKLEGGQYVQTWVVREFTPAELDQRLVAQKAKLNADVLELRDRDFAGGFTHTTDDARTFGVQIRGSDRINLLGLFTKAGMLVQAGATTPTNFRSVENETYPLSPAQLLAMAQAALVAYEAVMQASWDLKDQIDSATTFAELPVLPASLLA